MRLLPLVYSWSGETLYMIVRHRPSLLGILSCVWVRGGCDELDDQSSASQPFVKDVPLKAF
jgi:hypothetical protein